MTPRKILIIIGIVVAVLIVGAIVISFLLGGPTANSGAPINGSSSVGVVGVNPPVAPSTFPTSTTITIGTAKGAVVVNNFYNTMVSYDEGTVVFKQTSNYALTYDTTDSSFWIDVTAGDPPTVEKTAEADFISELGITQAEACELNASWGVEYSVSPSLAGQDYPLTFCPAL